MPEVSEGVRNRMTRTFCDKCGKEIKDNDPTIAEVKITTMSSQHFYDLCQSCRFRLEGWLENAEDNVAGGAESSNL